MRKYQKGRIKKRQKEDKKGTKMIEKLSDEKVTKSKIKYIILRYFRISNINKTLIL